MKKIFIFSLIFLIPKLLFAVPSNTISLPNSFTPNTTISSSAVNSNFNEGQTKFNAHTHTDITETGAITSGTWNANIIDKAYGGTGLSTSLFKTVTYTGNNTDDRNIAHTLGATPNIVLIVSDATTQGAVLYLTGFTAGNSINLTDGTVSTNGIQAVDSTNVQIGTLADVNTNTRAYIMLVGRTN